jgi:hypothetical protein
MERTVPFGKSRRNRVSVLAATVFRNAPRRGKRGEVEDVSVGVCQLSFVVKHGVENHEKLAHAGGERRFRIFPARTQLGVEILDNGIGADRGDYGHIQDAPDLRASAPENLSGISCLSQW